MAGAEGALRGGAGSPVGLGQSGQEEEGLLTGTQGIHKPTITFKLSLQEEFSNGESNWSSK